MPTTEPAQQQAHTVVFDGVCKLCNGAVRFIIKRDPQARFNFVRMQSSVGQQLMHNHSINPNNSDSLLLIKSERVFTQSDAALEIAAELRGFWPVLRWLKLLPKPLRNGLYQLVARNRYKLFGKQPSCSLPPADAKSRFIDADIDHHV